MAEFYRKKKKVCQMCIGKSVDYKDADMFVSKVKECVKFFNQFE